MPGSADPSSAVHAESDVARTAQSRLAGMNANPDAKLRTVWPTALGKAALARDGGRQRLLRPPERDEERIALRVDLVASALCENLTQNLLVTRQRVPVPLPAQMLEELCRTLDIGEEKGDRADRQFVD